MIIWWTAFFSHSRIWITLINVITSRHLIFFWHRTRKVTFLSDHTGFVCLSNLLWELQRSHFEFYFRYCWQEDKSHSEAFIICEIFPIVRCIMCFVCTFGFPVLWFAWYRGELFPTFSVNNAFLWDLSFVCPSVHCLRRIVTAYLFSLNHPSPLGQQRHIIPHGVFADRKWTPCKCESFYLL